MVQRRETGLREQLFVLLGKRRREKKEALCDQKCLACPPLRLETVAMKKIYDPAALASIMSERMTLYLYYCNTVLVLVLCTTLGYGAFG
jgi:hypothetical protein